MIIFDKNNSVILDIPVDDDSYRYRSVMQAKKVELNYSLPGHVELPVGSYIDFQGERYTLWYPENFQKQGTRNFSYKVAFGGNEEILKKYKYKFLSEKPYKLKFPLTAKPQIFLQLLVDNLNLYDSGWSVGQCIDAAEKALSFSHESCMDALNRVGNEFSTEWEIINKTINLCKVERFKAEPLPLSYGRGNGFKTGVGRTSQGDKQPVTLLYVEGGERNIDFSTYKSKTLLLPKSQEMGYEGRRYKTDKDGMYITRADKELTDYNEDSFDATNFYPSRVGTVSKVEAIKQGENTFYDFFDNEIPEALDYSKCRIDGQKATIIFQTGKLTGKEFDIVQTDKVLTGYVHAEKRFKLAPAEIDGLTMPNETFCPEIGDTYAVFNISLPEAYVCDDETKTGGSWDMFKEAVRYFFEHEEEAFTFKGDLDGIWAKRNWLEIGGKIQPGAYILFSDIQFQPKGIPIRITGVRDYINKPYSPQIELSNIPVAGFVSNDLNKIEENEVVVDHKHKEAISYTQRRFRDAKEQQSLLEKAFLDFSEGVNPIWVQTMSLLVGQEALQFRFVNSKTNPIEADHAFNYSNESKVFETGAAILQHMTLGIDTLSSSHATSEYKFWDMEAYTSPALSVDPSPLYLYAKCKKDGITGTFILSKTVCEMNTVGDYYFFLVGTLSSEVGGVRSFAPVYGFSEIGPGWMRLNKIISPDGWQYWDMLSKAFRIGDENNYLAYNADGQKQLIIKGMMYQSPSGDTDYPAVDRGGYVSTVQYYPGDQVNSDGNVYKCFLMPPAPGVAPTTTKYWKVLVRKGDKGDSGNVGPSPVFRGEFKAGTYYNNEKRRDIVKNGSVYYIYAGQDAINIVSFDASQWENFGSQFVSVATDLLLASWANLAGFIYNDAKMYSQDVNTATGVANLMINARDGSATFGGDNKIIITPTENGAVLKMIASDNVEVFDLSFYKDGATGYYRPSLTITNGETFLRASSNRIVMSSGSYNLNVASNSIRISEDTVSLFSVSRMSDGTSSIELNWATQASARSGYVYKDANGFLKVK